MTPAEKFAARTAALDAAGNALERAFEEMCVQIEKTCKLELRAYIRARQKMLAHARSLKRKNH